MYLHIGFISRIVVGAVMISSGFGKCVNLRWFIAALEKYDLVKKIAAPPLAVVIALLECVVGVGLLSGIMLSLVSFIGMVMLLIFSMAVGIKLSQGKFNIACGCNSFLKRARIGWQIVFRNAGLVGLILLAGMPLLGTVMWRLAIFTFSLGLIALPLIWKESLSGTANAVAQH
jgi:uncharacterized membrane protein YphA (DoxX/SURF4 family)